MSDNMGQIDEHFIREHAAALLHENMISFTYNSSGDLLITVAQEGPEYALWAEGLELEKQGQFEEALVCFDRALDINSKFAEVWADKADLLQSLERTDEALFCYTHALALDPHNQQAWFNKGVLYINAFKLISSLPPANGPFANGPFNEAINCLKKAQQLGNSKAGAIIDVLQPFQTLAQIGPPISSSASSKGECAIDELFQLQQLMYKNLPVCEPSYGHIMRDHQLLHMVTHGAEALEAPCSHGVLLPTNIQNRYEYVILKGLIKRMEQAAEQALVDMPASVVFGTLPTGHLDAITIKVQETDEYICCLSKYFSLSDNNFSRHIII